MPGMQLQGRRVAAWANDNDPFHAQSHTFGLWVLTVALLAAVLAFCIGKEVVHGIRYPGVPYSLSADQLVEWDVLAVLAGTRCGELIWLGYSVDTVSRGDAVRCDTKPPPAALPQ